MRNVARLLFLCILLFMIGITVRASMERGVFEAGSLLWPHWWFRATLADAYCGFLTFFAWVAFKERSLWRKSLWFALILTLGNIAMSAYVLIQLARLPASAPFSDLLTRQNA